MSPLRSRTLPWKEPRAGVFALAALGAHLALALTLRVTVWPEVTTPGYLWSRGLLLYRDIKFPHTPGTMGTLALAFLLFGVHTWVVRAYALAGPLVAHCFVLRHGRSFSLPIRALVSAFFLVTFFVSDGNAVWPTVVLSALAIPIATALGRERFALAGLLIGMAILFKQTTAYLLLLALAVLLARKRFREAAILFLAGSLPYALAVVAFGLLGAAPEMLRWTIVVPFTILPPVVVFKPGFFTLMMLLAGFVPTALEAFLERKGEYETSAGWLLVVAAVFAAICYPRFDMLQTVASVPPLAIGTARLLRRSGRWLPAAAFAFVTALTVSRGAVLMGGGWFDGKALFWNEDPAFNELVTRLRRLPPDTPLHSMLWGNLLPRTGLLPPGRLYVHPWFDWLFPVDRIGERIEQAAARPGTVVVGYRGFASGGEIVGPYQFVKR